MNRQIALFRGINVGGKNLLPMKELIALLQQLGLRDVQSYIQSGNLLFSCTDDMLPGLDERISAAVEAHYGFSPAVLLLSASDWHGAMQRNPFPEGEAEPATLHLGFLAAPAEAADWKGLNTLQAVDERYAVVGCVFYLHAPSGIGRSKLVAKAEQLLKVAMTMRNWRTVCQLAQMFSSQQKDQ